MTFTGFLARFFCVCFLLALLIHAHSSAVNAVVHVFLVHFSWSCCFILCFTYRLYMLLLVFFNVSALYPAFQVIFMTLWVMDSLCTIVGHKLIESRDTFTSVADQYEPAPLGAHLH